MTDHPSLQERLAPGAVCFGCGPANPDGLHIRSYVAGEPGAPSWSAVDVPRGEVGEAGPETSAAAGRKSAKDEGSPVPAPDCPEVVADWPPEPRFEAFEGFLNGGVISTLLDCHSNWAATYALMRQSGTDRLPSTVTADLAVRMRRPTPTRLGPVRLRARVVELRADRATVESTLEAGGQLCVTSRATFVAVGPGHPAYGRW